MSRKFDKKQEGKQYEIDNNVLDNQTTLEVGLETSDTKVDNKQSFEDYKKIYADAINNKVIELYGVADDKSLWEDVAKEMYLSSENYIPTEDIKVEGELDTKLEEAKTNNKAEFVLVPANSARIKQLENGSAFTWEGMDLSHDNLQNIVDYLKENTPNIKLPVNFYTWKGKEFNEMYGLTGNNAYPEDLNFLSIALDNWDGLGTLPLVKMQMGARWLDDIVDNNAVRQNNMTENKKFDCNRVNLGKQHLIEAKDIDIQKVINMSYDELPDMCYGLLPSDNSIIVIKKGENGYYETDFGHDTTTDDNMAEELVNHLNAKRGITPEQRMAMELRSLNGNWKGKKDEDYVDYNDPNYANPIPQELKTPTPLEPWSEKEWNTYYNDYVDSRIKGYNNAQENDNLEQYVSFLGKEAKYQFNLDDLDFGPGKYKDSIKQMATIYANKKKDRYEKVRAMQESKCLKEDYDYEESLNELNEILDYLDPNNAMYSDCSDLASELLDDLYNYAENKVDEILNKYFPDVENDDLKVEAKTTETIGDILNELDNMYTIGEINEIVNRFKSEINRKIVNDEIESVEFEYPDIYDMDEDSEEYERIINELKSCIESDFSGEEELLNESKELSSEAEQAKQDMIDTMVEAGIDRKQAEKDVNELVELYLNNLVTTINGKTVDQKRKEQQDEIDFYKKMNEVKQKTVGDNIKIYDWEDKDVEFIKSLVGDTITIRIEDEGRTYGNIVDLKLTSTEYIDSGIVNFTRKFYEEVEKYIKSKYPNAELSLNNTGSIMWIREKTDKGSDKVTSKIENKKLQEGDTYDGGIFKEIEEAFEEAGLNPRRFIDEGVLTKNIGWTLYSDRYGSQQISCDGSWYDPEDDDEDDFYKDDEVELHYVDEGKKLQEHTESWLENTDPNNHRVKPFVDYFKSEYPDYKIDKLWLEVIEGGWEPCVAFIESDGTTYRIYLADLNSGSYMSGTNSIKIADSNYKNEYDFIEESKETVKTESKQDRCIICGNDNLDGCYILKSNNICKDCGKKYSLEEIEAKLKNKKIKTESDTDLPNITWILEDYEVEASTKAELGSDYLYHTLVTNEREAEKFNYHSDYWGDANTYQEEMVDFVSTVEPYVGKNVVIDYDDESRECKVLGVLIDKQYNSLSHAKILVEEI